MKTAQVGILITVALLVQTTVIKIGAGGGTPVDFVLIVVVLTALQRGPVVGLWAGTFGGLFQDALSGGIIGVSGLTKTIIGVGSGVVGSRFILGTVWHRLAFVIGASLVQAFSYLGIYSLIGLKSPMVSFNAGGVEAGLN
jgi:rod shape-determining protein MreD